MEFLLTTLFAFVFAAIGVPIFLGICRLFLVYTTVKECRCKVFVLFDCSIRRSSSRNARWKSIR